jgi:carbamoyltransferase
VTTKPWILGISASHNGAACLLHGDDLAVAVQEERLSGVKRARVFGAFPSLAVRYCLDRAGIAAKDLSLVALCTQSHASHFSHDVNANPQLDVVRNAIPTVTISHHIGHAVSAFVMSGFSDAAVLIVDGMGSPTPDMTEEERRVVVDGAFAGSETVSMYHMSTRAITPLEKHIVRDGGWLREPPPGESMYRFGSLGGMFSAAADQIFGNTMDAGKVMGLAPYGRVELAPDRFFAIHSGRYEYFDDVPKLFTSRERWPQSAERYQNLAAAVQAALEYGLTHLAGRLRGLCDSLHLAYAGGVALNSVANERLIRQSRFRDVFIVPAAEDSGPAVGAAYHGLWMLTGEYRSRKIRRDACGCVYGSDDVDRAIADTPCLTVTRPADVIQEATERLMAGEIIGWFTGGAELGPRALGQRSILCDARRPQAKDELNLRVKHREPFRPFAPVVLLEEVQRWFDVDGVDPESPFMLRVLPFREEKKHLVPAAVHVDGTGRVQTVTREANGRLYDLVAAFHQRTGVPMLLNTSFNLMGEPIIETPADALWCLLLTGLHACVFDGAVVAKQPGVDLEALRPQLIDAGAVRAPSQQRGGLNVAVNTPWGEHVLVVADPIQVATLNELRQPGCATSPTVPMVIRAVRRRPARARTRCCVRWHSCGVNG